LGAHRLNTVVAIVVGLVAIWAALVAVLWVFRPRDVSLAELVGVVSDVVRLVRDLIADRAIALHVRVALIGLLIWLVSPIDLIPEFVPVIGPLDDVVVAVLVLRWVRRRVGTEELRQRWRGTEAGFDLLVRILGSS
jgi:uncharacterized membrane protein YkvA (DUF1232 family)